MILIINSAHFSNDNCYYCSKKKVIWQTIEKEYNIVGEFIYRDADVLKRKYDNLKKRGKERLAQEKMSNVKLLDAAESTALLALVEEFATVLEDKENDNDK